MIDKKSAPQYYVTPELYHLYLKIRTKLRSTRPKPVVSKIKDIFDKNDNLSKLIFGELQNNNFSTESEAGKELWLRYRPTTSPQALYNFIRAEQEEFLYVGEKLEYLSKKFPHSLTDYKEEIENLLQKSKIITS